MPRIELKECGFVKSSNMETSCRLFVNVATLMWYWVPRPPPAMTRNPLRTSRRVAMSPRSSTVAVNSTYLLKRSFKEIINACSKPPEVCKGSGVSLLGASVLLPLRPPIPEVRFWNFSFALLMAALAPASCR